MICAMHKAGSWCRFGQVTAAAVGSSASRRETGGAVSVDDVAVVYPFIPHLASFDGSSQLTSSSTK